jgi:hypothetical protein
MGTNYYFYKKPPCGHCGRPFDRLHIGKSSGGWCFTLHVIPEMGINDLEDWEKVWQAPGAYIENEYGYRITFNEMKRIITDRSWPPKHKSINQEWYDRNHSEPGPNGLARHKIGMGCVKHGAGTWDCVEGEFS